MSLYSAFNPALFGSATPLGAQNALAFRFRGNLAPAPLDFLKEAGSQRVKHRQGAASDLFRQQFSPVRGVFHLRVLRVSRFHCLA